MLMTLEEEIKLEVKRLEREIAFLDNEIDKLQSKLTQLLMIKKKKERDLNILKSNFEPVKERKELQTSLFKMLNKT
jgi:prefoldin subunit 5